MHQHPAPVFVSVPQLTRSIPSGVARPRHDEKEVHGRAEPNNQGINRGHDGVAPRRKGSLAEICPLPACADARRREVKAQPKAAAKTTKKTAAKSQPASRSAPKATAKAAKPAGKTTPAKTHAKVAVKAVPKAPAKATKPVAKAPAKTPAKAAPAKAAKSTVKAAPKTARTAAGKVVGAVAKAVVSGAKAVVAAAKKIPAKASPAPAKAVSAKASHPPAAPAAAHPAPVPAPAPKPAPAAPRAAQPPAVATPAAPGAAKASYIPMATQSVLTPPPMVAIKKDPKLANNWKTKSAEELTDEEVLAMPDTEYMNDKQMAFFRLKLLQLKQDILNSAGETTEHLREDTVIVPDPADRATIEEEHALELRTRDRERKLLKKIEQSIARIDAGDYGYCDETGEPIGVGRLLARPTATLSLEAQQRRELKQKMFGD
ncbi:RNA polymerase-binding protein DksA [Ramlibacter sp. AN1133]|uniref:RNA polymerase-binding protein DksA n=1 Tax=Ramlibacter sp. AN1133 TaxID=3133429 RepID=UPI0030C00FFA